MKAELLVQMDGTPVHARGLTKLCSQSARTRLRTLGGVGAGQGVLDRQLYIRGYTDSGVVPEITAVHRVPFGIHAHLSFVAMKLE